MRGIILLRGWNISLSDYRREVEIAGSSSSLVQALSAMIHEHLKARETFFGAGFRLGIEALVSTTFFSMVVLNLLINLKKRVILSLSVATLISWALYICVTFVFPLEEWLPGTAIYMDTASFFERHSPEITLFGTIFALISLFVGVLWRKARDR